MKIVDMYRQHRPAISFEFFPPKTEAGTANLFRTIESLKTLHPAFVSVTYGAMGSTRDITLDMVRRIKHDMGLEVMSHLSCVGATKAEIDEVLTALQAADIGNVLALGGDPPKDQTLRDKSTWGFVHANELAAYIKTMDYFCIGGACYPEGHVEAPSKTVDLHYCKRKVEDGVDFLITQLFFDNRDYFDFLDRARAAGIDVPIIPGIMPVTNFKQIKRFARICGATIPERMQQDLTPIEDDLEQVEAYGTDYATQQCQELLEAGVAGFHFYTLNKASATTRILINLQLT